MTIAVSRLFKIKSPLQ